MDETEEEEKADMEQEMLSTQERKQKRLDRKPDMTLYPTAMNGLSPIFAPGDRVICERWTRLIGDGTNPEWLDTLSYTVKDVDLETGVIKVMEEESGHRASLSFKDGLHRFYFRG